MRHPVLYFQLQRIRRCESVLLKQVKFRILPGTIHTVGGQKPSPAGVLAHLNEVFRSMSCERDSSAEALSLNLITTFRLVARKGLGASSWDSVSEDLPHKIDFITRT